MTPQELIHLTRVTEKESMYIYAVIIYISNSNSSYFVIGHMPVLQKDF